jgi:hypothetical protein
MYTIADGGITCTFDGVQLRVMLPSFAMTWSTPELTPLSSLSLPEEAADLRAAAEKAGGMVSVSRKEKTSYETSCPIWERVAELARSAVLVGEIDPSGWENLMDLPKGMSCRVISTVVTQYMVTGHDNDCTVREVQTVGKHTANIAEVFYELRPNGNITLKDLSARSRIFGARAIAALGQKLTLTGVSLAMPSHVFALQKIVLAVERLEIEWATLRAPDIGIEAEEVTFGGRPGPVETIIVTDHLVIMTKRFVWCGGNIQAKEFELKTEDEFSHQGGKLKQCGKIVWEIPQQCTVSVEAHRSPFAPSQGIEGVPDGALPIPQTDRRVERTVTNSLLKRAEGVFRAMRSGRVESPEEREFTGEVSVEKREVSEIQFSSGHSRTSSRRTWSRNTVKQPCEITRYWVSRHPRAVGEEIEDWETDLEIEDEIIIAPRISLNGDTIKVAGSLPFTFAFLGALQEIRLSTASAITIDRCVLKAPRISISTGTFTVGREGEEGQEETKIVANRLWIHASTARLLGGALVMQERGEIRVNKCLVSPEFRLNVPPGTLPS